MCAMVALDAIPSQSEVRNFRLILPLQIVYVVFLGYEYRLSADSRLLLRR